MEKIIATMMILLMMVMVKMMFSERASIYMRSMIQKKFR